MSLVISSPDTVAIDSESAVAALPKTSEGGNSRGEDLHAACQIISKGPARSTESRFGWMAKGTLQGLGDFWTVIEKDEDSLCLE